VNLRAVQVTDERSGDISDHYPNAVEMFHGFLDSSKVFCEGCRHLSILLRVARRTTE
jgi:hypothetical protein